MIMMMMTTMMTWQKASGVTKPVVNFEDDLNDIDERRQEVPDDV